MRLASSVCAVGLCASALAAGAARGPAGRLMEGTDVALIELPAGVAVEPYRAPGYRLETVDGRARVEVELFPLASRAPFRPPAAEVGGDEPSRLARRLTAGLDSRFAAVSRLLGWIAGNLRYEPNRSLDQDPTSVLRRGDAYCTGAARLAVALLAAVGIPAREVPGYVAGEDGGFHRWIEVHYPDRGWLASDPLRSHHFVPATYVRLAGERIAGVGAPVGGRLLERHDRLVAVDVVPGLPAAVRARGNGARRRAGAVAIDAGTGASRATLEGVGRRYTLELIRGRGEFLDLAQGRYRLHVEHRDGAIERRVVIEGRGRQALHLTAGTVPDGAARGRSRPPAGAAPGEDYTR